MLLLLYFLGKLDGNEKGLLSFLKKELIVNTSRFPGVFAKLRKSDYLSHVYLFVRNNSTPTGRIFIKFDAGGFFENLTRKYKFHYNMTRITGTLRKELCTFMTTSCLFLRRMRNILR